MIPHLSGLAGFNQYCPTHHPDVILLANQPTILWIDGSNHIGDDVTGDFYDDFTPALISRKAGSVMT